MPRKGDKAQAGGRVGRRFRARPFLLRPCPGNAAKRELRRAARRLGWGGDAGGGEGASFSGLTRESCDEKAREPPPAGDARVKPEHDVLFPDRPQNVPRKAPPSIRKFCPVM